MFVTGREFVVLVEDSSAATKGTNSIAVEGGRLSAMSGWSAVEHDIL